MEIHRIRSMTSEEKNEVHLLLLQGLTRLKYWGAIQSDKTLVFLLRMLLKARRKPMDRLSAMSAEERHQIQQLVLEGVTKTKAWADIQPDSALVAQLRELLLKHNKRSIGVNTQESDCLIHIEDDDITGGENSDLDKHSDREDGGDIDDSMEPTILSPFTSMDCGHHNSPACTTDDIFTSFHPSGRTPPSLLWNRRDPPTGGVPPRSVLASSQDIPRQTKSMLSPTPSENDDEFFGCCREVPVPSEYSSEAVGASPLGPSRSRTSTFDEPALIAQHANTCRRCQRCEDYEAELALWEACATGAFECARYLIEAKGVDYDKSDKDGWTPVHTAARAGHLDIVKYLIDKGVNFEETGSIPADTSHGGEDSPPNEIEEEKGADNEENENDVVGWTPVHAASQEGHLEIVQFLVNEKGANYEEPDQYGWTPVHIASEGGHSEVVQFLIEKGADFERTNKHGRTPLHVAAREGHLDLVKFLIEENGAD
eukprot:Rmarinus@m.19872